MLAGIHALLGLFVVALQLLEVRRRAGGVQRALVHEVDLRLAVLLAQQTGAIAAQCGQHSLDIGLWNSLVQVVVHLDGRIRAILLSHVLQDKFLCSNICCDWRSSRNVQTC